MKNIARKLTLTQKRGWQEGVVLETLSKVAVNEQIPQCFILINTSSINLAKRCVL